MHTNLIIIEKLINGEYITETFVSVCAPSSFFNI